MAQCPLQQCIPASRIKAGGTPRGLGIQLSLGALGLLIFVKSGGWGVGRRYFRLLPFEMDS